MVLPPPFRFGILAAICSCLVPLVSYSHTLPDPVADWHFWPNYTLPGNAENFPGPKIDAPVAPFQKLDWPREPLLWFGEAPTERLINALPAQSIPRESFTIEAWLSYHVNQPVGMLVAAKDPFAPEQPNLLLGLQEKEVVYSLMPEGQSSPAVIDHQLDRGWSRYWHHLVANYDGQNMRLFVNGEEVGRQAINGRAALPSDYELELAAYMKREPYMQLSNLLKQMRIYDIALTADQIDQRFAALQNRVERAILFPELFHYTAGPYLNDPTQESIKIVWETDRPANSTIRFGESLPLDESSAIAGEPLADYGQAPRVHFIQQITLPNLKPDTKYFYEVLSVDDATSEEISSGVLTFATAVEESAPFTFAILGDTEVRPHINDRVAKLIWDERPNFALNLGDMTDQGRGTNKFQWTYEYFVGMTQLHSRIPVLPVAGNGEGDLYWFNRYHGRPGPAGYYKFNYGNAAFYILDSNQRKDAFSPGGEQYEWLDAQLQKCTATWKFVAHHHAPYSADENDYGNSWAEPTNHGDPHVRPIVPLYEKHDVDMVFFGHLHTYQRTMPIQNGKVTAHNGVIYVQGGGGGGNLEDFAPTRAWFSAKTFRGHHYLTINILGDQLSLRMYDLNGRLNDVMRLEK